MKGFNSEQYRDELAGKLKEIRKTEDFRSPEEKEAAQPSVENGPHAKMKAVLDEAKETPEYLFSKEKNKRRRYEKELSAIAEKYFATEFTRGETLDSGVAKEEFNIRTHNRSNFVIPEFPLGESRVEKRKGIVSLDTEHVDLKLAKKPTEDKWAEREDYENKYVVVEMVQPSEDDPRVDIGDDFVRQFPEYKKAVVSIFDRENNISELLKGVEVDKDKLKEFFIEKIHSVTLSELPDPIGECFIIGRPEDTHAVHRNIADVFTAKNLVPEAGSGFIQIRGREYNVLGKAQTLFEKVQKMGSDVDDATINELVELCIEISIRKKTWNQKNPPLAIVDGGGFMDVMEDGTIVVRGESQGFGEEKDRSKTLAILESELPNTKFVLE